ncbi:MAG: glutathione S-transferase family protein [Deltaproteobacteria bacterium]|jgi:glutathione S-transferase|nr:glutathione S-transferase family protein [Deltaproteobacteria bacterium]
MTKITFYTNPMSRGQIARWALHEAGADYDEVLLAYGEEMKSADYLQLNPMGKVPAIVHEGNVVTEAAAICMYLAEAFPDARLAPRSLAHRAAYLRWTFFAAGPLEQAVVNKSMGWSAADDPQVQGRLGYGNYDRTIQTLVGHFEANDYVCGDLFTAADIYVGAHVDWGLQFGTVEAAPALNAYADRLRAREAYKAAKSIDGAHIAKMRPA